MEEDYHCMDTILVHGDKGYDSHTGAISYPIYQTATFKHPGLNQSTGFDYSRVSNPTRDELEHTIAKLEKGKMAFAFSSGMAGITAVFNLFSAGEHIIVSDDLYGGTYRLFEEICTKQGMEFSYVDTSKVENVLRELRSNTSCIFIETPSNPMMKVTDIKKVAKLTRESNALMVVDNTFLTPYLQRPIELGADIVVHSGTKYLAGHNDTLAGFVIANEQKIIEQLNLIYKTTGAVLSPFDSWLVLRGLKTLAIRLEKQERNALKIAQWLKEHKLIERVLYVGLAEHQGFDISQQQATGAGAMISFVVQDKEIVKKVLENLQIISFAESLGGVESLITYPIAQTHCDIPDEMRERLGVNDRLLRLSVGIEDANDLIRDLEQALVGID
ncbi:MAG: PLP-dependent transferase [Firmicutes bacterium]|nr:PLP-dependent transferase [Bacillota bacterium]